MLVQVSSPSRLLLLGCWGRRGGVLLLSSQQPPPTAAVAAALHAHLSTPPGSSRRAWGLSGTAVGCSRPSADARGRHWGTRQAAAVFELDTYYQTNPGARQHNIMGGWAGQLSHLGLLHPRLSCRRVLRSWDGRQRPTVDQAIAPGLGGTQAWSY
jgi:hypothetical protein